MTKKERSNRRAFQLGVEAVVVVVVAEVVVVVVVVAEVVVVVVVVEIVNVFVLFFVNCPVVIQFAELGYVSKVVLPI